MKPQTKGQNKNKSSSSIIKSVTFSNSVFGNVETCTFCDNCNKFHRELADSTLKSNFYCEWTKLCQ